MYVPPYKVVARALGLVDKEADPGNPGWISDSFLRFLIEKVVVQLPFDKTAYLAANPDIEQAIRKGDVISAHEHYIRFGYFEGRDGAGPAFKESWYLKKYPDVAAAVKSGEWPSGWHHYKSEGVFEWRVPTEDAEQDVHRWQEALSQAEVPEMATAR